MGEKQAQMTLPEQLEFQRVQPDWAMASDLLWLGALSFEARCAASLSLLKETCQRLRRVVIIDYGDRVRPEEPGRDARALNKVEMTRYLSGEIEDVWLDPYSTFDWHTEIGPRLAVEDMSYKTKLVVDLTCLTKAHSIVLWEELAPLVGRDAVALAYTVPENYCSLAEQRRDFGGWRDCFVLPVVRGAKIANEAQGRGIIIPGHESARLVVALGEIEPTEGTILRAVTEHRPDFEAVTLSRNQKLLKHLGASRKWREKRVGFTEFGRTWRIAEREIEAAKDAEAPLFIYPFGPKSLIASVSCAAAQLYPEGSWFVYPAPSFHDLHYTEGIGPTYWLRL